MSGRVVRSATALALATLLGACTVGGTHDASAPTSPPTTAAGRAARASGSSTPGTTSKPPVPPPPKQPACYRLRFAQLPRASNDSPMTRCRKRHDAVTVFVGKLHTVADGQPVGVDSKAAQAEMARRCPHRLARFVGGGPVLRHLSRFAVVWFSPTPQQADLGARWFRCDLIAFAGPDRLFPLPRPHRLKGVLDQSGALDTYGLCGTAAPGANGFERVICARRHTWRAISTISLSGGTKYPGPRVVRRAGDATCRDRVKATLGFTLRFSYGWEWPKRDQWRRGQHYGYCWAPD